jgi:hypothetical protein
MNSDFQNTAAARRILRQITSETCDAYNRFCSTECEETVFQVLEGELRMAAKLAEIELKLTDNPRQLPLD